MLLQKWYRYFLRVLNTRVCIHLQGGTCRARASHHTLTLPPRQPRTSGLPHTKRTPAVVSEDWHTTQRSNPSTASGTSGGTGTEGDPHHHHHHHQEGQRWWARPRHHHHHYHKGEWWWKIRCRHHHHNHHYHKGRCWWRHRAPPPLPPPSPQGKSLEAIHDTAAGHHRHLAQSFPLVAVPLTNLLSASTAVNKCHPPFTDSTHRQDTALHLTLIRETVTPTQAQGRQDRAKKTVPNRATGQLYTAARVRSL